MKTKAIKSAADVAGVKGMSDSHKSGLTTLLAVAKDFSIEDVMAETALDRLLIALKLRTSTAG